MSTMIVNQDDNDEITHNENDQKCLSWLLSSSLEPSSLACKYATRTAKDLFCIIYEWSWKQINFRYDTIVDADNLVKPDSDRRTVSLANSLLCKTIDLQNNHKFSFQQNKIVHFQEDMSLNSSSEFSQRTDRGGMQIGSDPEESEKEVKMNMGQEEKEEEEKGEKVKGSKEKEESVKENMEDANGVKDGPIRSSLWPTYLKVSSIFKQINKALVKI